MNGIYARWAFLLASKIESAAFGATRLAAIPAWLSFQLARPQPEPLDYTALLSLLPQFRTVPKSTLADTQQHQQKWAKRVIRIANLYGSGRILEVGSGHGFAAQFMHKAGLRVTASDIQDIRDPVVKKDGLEFVPGDVCERLPFHDNQFDLVFSINSFEHFDRPQSAMDEMLRVLRPGGLIYLTFDPLYYSPWGLHASRRLGMPYPQILFSPDTIQRFVEEKQAEIAHTYSEGSDRTKIGPPLNGYSLGQFREIFRQRKTCLRLLVYIERTSLDGLAMIRKYPGLFKAAAPSFEDLIVAGIKLLGEKQGQ